MPIRAFPDKKIINLLRKSYGGIRTEQAKRLRQIWSCGKHCASSPPEERCPSISAATLAASSPPMRLHTMCDELLNRELINTRGEGKTLWVKCVKRYCPPAYIKTYREEGRRHMTLQKRMKVRDRIT
jgi:hypothetical protein